MVFVNQTLLNIYTLDTPESIANRIAWILNVLPKYLYINTLPTIRSPKEEKVNYILIMEELATKSIMESIPTLQPYFSPEIILDAWVLLNPNVDETQIRMFLETVFDRYISPSQIDGDFYQQELNNFISTQYQLQQRLFIIDDYPKSSIGDYIIDTEEFVYEFEWKDGLDYLFDKLCTTPRIIAILYKSYLKLRPSFTPKLNWIARENTILLKTIYEENIELILMEDNKHIEIRLQNPKTLEYLETSLSLPINIQITSEKKGYIEAQQKINMFILSDILLTFGLKNYFFQLQDYVSFNDHNISSMNTLSQRFLVGKLPLEEKTYKCSIVPSQTSTRIYCNNDEVEFWSFLMGLVLSIYRNEENRVVFDYAQQGLNLLDDVKDQEETRKLTVRYPSIFTNRYTTTCQPNYLQPILLKDSEVEQRRADGYTVFQFPKEGDNRLPTRWYSCQDKLSDPFGKHKDANQNPLKNAPYAGLSRVSGSIIDGFAPCCKKTDQRQKNSPFVEYYFPEEFRQRTHTGAYIRKGKGTLSEGEVATLPDDDISYCLRQLSSYDIQRYGVKQSVNSFLSCVLKALNINQDVEDARKNLLNSISPFYLKQQLYDMNDREIREYVLGDEYLDPLKVLPLIEEVYNCHILLFVKDSQYPKGSLRIPRHTYGYVEFEKIKTRPFLLIYTSTGSLREQRQYPQSELLFYKDDKKQVFQFKGDDMLIYNCLDVYFNLYKFGYGIHPVPPIPRQFPFDIQQQFIDAQGKVRQLVIRSSGVLYHLNTSPLPPFKDVDVYLELKPSITYYDDAFSFLSTFGTPQQTEYELNVWWNGIQFSLTEIQPKEFAYDMFILHNQTARALTDWSLYFLSQYLNRTNQTSITNEFINNTFFIKSTHVYKRVGPRFLYEDGQGILDYQNKIICTSENIRNRLIYQLQFELSKNRQHVLDYQNKTILGNYYLYTFDYTSCMEETIIETNSILTPSIQTLLNSQTEHKVYNLPRDQDKPYYLNMGQDIALIQNTSSLKKASQISKGVFDNVFYTTYLTIYQTKDDIDTFLVRRKGNRASQAIAFKRNNQLHYGAILL